MVVKSFLKTVWKWTKRNSPRLLAGGAITSTALGYFFMHKEAPIVRKKLDELPEDATIWDKVKVGGPVYLPAILMFLMSSGCIVGGCAVGEKRAAIMASLYSASEASIRRLEKKMVEELGEEKTQELHDKASEEAALLNAPENPNDIICTGKGNQLCYELMTGQWFRSSLPAIENDAAIFNKHLVHNCWMDFNDWLTDGLGISRARFAEFFGFNLDHMVTLKISDSHRLVDGESYHIIDYCGGPVMYNGKRGIEFSACDDCYPGE